MVHMRHCMAAVLYCNGTIICNFGEKSGSLLGKNPASMGGSLASTKKTLYCIERYSIF